MRKSAVTLGPVLLAVAAMIGCGGNMSTPPPAPTVTTSSASVGTVINIGDAPNDSVLAFEITINSVLLTNSSGQQISVLSSPARIELTRLAGTFAPLSHVVIPQGTYINAVVTVSHPEIVFVNASGATVILEPQISNLTVTVPFSPSLVVGATSSPFNFDFDMSKSVVFDAAGVPSITPVITVVPSGARAGNDVDAEHGDLDEVKGIVTAINSPAFTMSLRDGTQTVTVNTDSNTKFSGITTLADLKAGMRVEVSASMNADGTLLARKVEAEVEIEDHAAPAASLEGLITATTGTSATQISILVRDMESSMSSAPALGSTVNIQISSKTKFAINDMDLLTTALPFTPTFDASTLSKGQNVEVETDMSTASATAAKVKLAKQTLRGTASAVVANGSLTTFTLTLPADSAFASLTGASTVTVYQTSATELKDMTSVTSGSSTRVRGLLFFDGTNFRFVAKRIDKS
jgi:Domain of unknown function (DUF5666)/Domain of unknown function (DUF4382)